MYCAGCGCVSAAPPSSQPPREFIDQAASPQTEGAKSSEERLDRYGFLRKGNDPLLRDIPQSIALRERTREIKWRRLLELSPNKYRVIRTREFRQKVRKGIPNPLRAEIWLNYLCDITADDLARAVTELSAAPTELEKTEQGRDAIECISKDLMRTYPTHIKFQKQEGQDQLKTVLMAYAAVDLEVGYCQGMSFLAALFLMYFSEKESLCMLKRVMNNSLWLMRDLFAPGMTAVSLRLFQFDAILKRASPRLATHFANLDLQSSMYATHWFATVFAYNFPYLVVLRIWDIFLAEGWPIVLGSAVAFWIRNEKRVLKITRFETLYDYLKVSTNDFSDSNIDEFISLACHIADKYAKQHLLLRLENRFKATMTKRQNS